MRSAPSIFSSTACCGPPIDDTETYDDRLLLPGSPDQPRFFFGCRYCVLVGCFPFPSTCLFSFRDDPLVLIADPRQMLCGCLPRACQAGCGLSLGLPDLVQRRQSVVPLCIPHGMQFSGGPPCDRT